MAHRAIAAALQSARDSLGDAKPNHGAGFQGPWPADGEHECYVVGLTLVHDEEFSIGWDDSKDEAVTVPGWSAQFHFQLAEDADNPEHPMEWDGAPFRFPLDFSKVTDRKRIKGLKAEQDRFAGHLSALLGADVGTKDGMAMGTALEKVEELLGSESEVIALVKCETRTFKYKKGDRAGEKGTGKRECIVKKLSS